MTIQPGERRGGLDLLDPYAKDLPENKEASDNPFEIIPDYEENPTPPLDMPEEIDLEEDEVEEAA